MDMGQIKRKKKEDKKSVLISIRITPKMSRWLKEKNYSPSGIFYEAVRELGFKKNRE